MFKPQYDASGNLLGKCESCGKLVTLAHWNANPTPVVTNYGETRIVYGPACEAGA